MVQFARALEYNAVEEWRQHYLDYELLKEKIYQLEKVKEKQETEGESSLQAQDTEGKKDKQSYIRDQFVNLLKDQVNGLSIFFMTKYDQILYQNDKTTDEVSQVRESTQGSQGSSQTGAIGRAFSRPSRRGSMDLGQPLLRHQRSVPISAQEVTESPRQLTKEDVALELTQSFSEISMLQSFVFQNSESLRKILKKYDKVLDDQIQDSELVRFRTQTPIFKKSTQDEIKARLDKIKVQYQELGYNTARLQLYQKEDLTFMQNSVWRNKLQRDTRTYDIQISDSNRYIIKFTAKQIAGISVSVLAFILILNINLLKLEVNQQRCLAILVLAAILWATEGLPLFATSYLIPILLVLFPTQQDLDLPRKDVAAKVVANMFSSVIPILLGTASLGSAMTHHNITQFTSSFILHISQGNIHYMTILIMIFCVGWAALISNVAVPILMLSLAKTFITQLRTGPEINTLLMGIAVSSNIGGMASPVASPQNIITLQYLSKEKASFMRWMCLSMPTCLGCLLVSYAVIYFYYKPYRNLPKVKKQERASVSITQWVVIVFGIIVVLMWILGSYLVPYFGDISIIALIPFVFFFGLKLLPSSELHALPWDVIALAQGGLCLGQAVKESDLLIQLTKPLQQSDFFSTHYVGSLLSITLITLFICSIVSHTVSALVLIPIIQEIFFKQGSDVPVVIVGLTCSLGMCLPVSGFPNMYCSQQRDEQQRTFLKPIDFLVVGGLVSIGCTMVLMVTSLTIGQWAYK